jgi:hypothetical protein
MASKFWVAFPLPRRYKDASILSEFYPKERCGARRTVEMIHAPGSLKNRMTRGEVEAKFRNSSGKVLPDFRREAVIGQVLNLERLDSVAALMKNLQP